MNAQASMTATKVPEQVQAGIEHSAAGEDRLLVAEAKSGNANAFEALYVRHRAKMHRVAYRILRNQQDAEDAVQRSFQRSFTNLQRFREDSSFSTWMTRIAINEALMLMRHRRPHRMVLEKDNGGERADFLLQVPDSRQTPEQAFAQAELRGVVTRAISKLRHNLRIVALLHEVHGLTSVEIARRLGLSVAAVKGRTFHAKRDLRRHLQRKFKGSVPAF
jgi:RNA polymerase sigma-70 factor (ECF subfamily)